MYEPQDGQTVPFGQICTLERESLIESMGNADLAYSERERRVGYSETTPIETNYLVASVDGSIVGWLMIEIPHTDNLRTAYFTSAAMAKDVDQVMPELWARAERQAKQRGRSLVQVFQKARTTANYDGRVLDQTGQSGLDSSEPMTAFLVDHGLTLGQVITISALELPVPNHVLLQLSNQAAPHHRDYHFVQWIDATPTQYQPAVAELNAAISVLAPSEGLEVEREQWSVDRVQREDQLCHEAGRRSFNTAAVFNEQLVGLTRITVPVHDQETTTLHIAYQQETVVLPAFQGHRLGMAMKVRNLQLLQDEMVQLDRLITFNAGQNDWMLAINRELGFRARYHAGEWQGTT